MTNDQDNSYVLGTHDAEIARLGVQHRVWRASVLDLWRLAGITQGHTVFDMGAGPGYGALDLAEVVGPGGQVVALERSARFLSHAAAAAQARGLTNLKVQEADLARFEWPREAADAIWGRWILAFLDDPEHAVRGAASALKPGGVLVLQEYYDYAAWRMAPHSAVFEDYVARIIARWRQSGGEPDIALALPAMLRAAGLQIELVRPVTFSARMKDFAARWPMGFAREHLSVMQAAGDIDEAGAHAVAACLSRFEANPDALVLTPPVLQIVARKPG